MVSYQFPDGFVWGVATAAAQIEGGGSDGNARRSNPGPIRHAPRQSQERRHPGNRRSAAHRLYEDRLRAADSARSLHYRLSVAWPPWSRRETDINACWA